MVCAYEAPAKRVVLLGAKQRRIWDREILPLRYAQGQNDTV
jgi:hypothetical protein